MKYSTNQFKAGLKVLIENEPCSILSYEFHKPGKGQAVMRTKLYNLRTQKVWERTFKSGESVEGADIVERDFQFLLMRESKLSLIPEMAHTLEEAKNDTSRLKSAVKRDSE